MTNYSDKLDPAELVQLAELLDKIRARVHGCDAVAVYLRADGRADVLFENEYDRRIARALLSRDSGGGPWECELVDPHLGGSRR